MPPDLHVLDKPRRLAVGLVVAAAVGVSAALVVIPASATPVGTSARAAAGDGAARLVRATTAAPGSVPPAAIAAAGHIRPASWSQLSAHHGGLASATDGARAAAVTTPLIGDPPAGDPFTVAANDITTDAQGDTLGVLTWHDLTTGATGTFAAADGAAGEPTWTSRPP